MDLEFTTIITTRFLKSSFLRGSFSKKNVKHKIDENHLEIPGYSFFSSKFSGEPSRNQF